MIVTPRSTLIEASIGFMRAVIADDRSAASRIAGASLPEEWPGTSDAHAGLPIHLVAMERKPDQLAWRIRLIVVDGIIVGSINLNGPPDARGEVEVGWGLISEARGRGLATEAANGVIEWVFAASDAQRVIATIPPDHDRSQQVALRLGMHPTAEIRRGLAVWKRTRSALP
jgi:RimJ/RimL family protein N-acetyltransferase